MLSFQMAWIISRRPGLFLDGVEFARLPEKFPESLKSFQMVWDLPDGLDSLQMAHLQFLLYAVSEGFTN